MITPSAIEVVAQATGIASAELSQLSDRQVSPGGRMRTAREVVNAALLLFTDEGRFIIGVLIPANAGQSFWPG